MSSFGLIKLLPTVQTYDWGRSSGASLVYKLASNALPAKFDTRSKYAELWLGAHPKSPSTALPQTSSSIGEKKLLSDLLSEAAGEVLGERIETSFCGKLPFLFKVLSIGAPLSIQAHPNLDLAKALNKDNPKQYPDSNHKPECSIALSPVELLYGFKSRTQLLASIVDVPELFTIIPGANISHLESMSEADLRREVLSAIMNCDASMLRSACCSLQKRFSSVGKLNSVDSWVLSLCEKYPDGDPGILCFYLMNFETLDVGDAIYIGPNIAHAYLSGELVECMANSDNVVRAGLTPKYKDVQVLLDMLDYQVGPLEKQCAGEGTEGLFEFSFPAEEFALSAIKNTTVSLQTRGAELIFLLEGAASVVSGQNELSLRPGEGVLVSADVGEYSLRVDAGTAYRVSVP